MTLLLVGLFVTFISGLISLGDKWKKQSEEGYKKNNNYAIGTFIVAMIGIMATFSSANNSMLEKQKNDTLILKKDIENKKIANELIETQKRIIDTSRNILLTSLKINELQSQIVSLQNELYGLMAGGKQIPAIITFDSYDKITFSILCHDKYPMINVKIKCKEITLPDVGTLYPNVITNFLTVDIPFSAKEELYYFTIFYNNKKTLFVDVNVKRDSNGWLNSTVKYLDKNQKEFKHPYQGRNPKRNESIKSIKDHHYQSELHF